MQKESLLNVLQKKGIIINSPCGGNGTCRKCLVKVGGKKILACKTFDFNENDKIEIISNENMEVINVYESLHKNKIDRNINFGVSIDIGTTTVAFELINVTSGKNLAAFSCINKQRAYGADVISRIKSANEGNLDVLKKCIHDDILNGINEIITKAGLVLSDIGMVVIAGNETMLHLLQGLPCETLGIYPFTPVTVGIKKVNFNEIFDSKLICDLVVLPGISTFVGADISAGLLHCGFLKNDEVNLLIDLGTNGEMALQTPGKIYVTSTAAGPAFEAGNISCGVGSVKGAIAKVNFSKETGVFMYKTIENKEAVGICGTGVVDITAELVKYSLIDETGLLEDAEINLTKTITFTQKDIREVQLAKSAVRTGIEILLETAECKYEDIKNVYLAGGFGYKMNVNSAATIGLIPSKLKERVIAVGNASLGGATKVLLSEIEESTIIKISSIAEEVNIAKHPKFNELFMDYMTFEKSGLNARH